MFFIVICLVGETFIIYGSIVGKWADKGRIGLSLSSDAGSKSELTVNEVQIQPLE